MIFRLKYHPESLFTMHRGFYYNYKVKLMNIFKSAEENHLSLKFRKGSVYTQSFKDFDTKVELKGMQYYFQSRVFVVVREQILW
jgi:hypothetical protein